MKSSKTYTLVGMGILTAIVIVLQALGSVIRFGPFSISLVLAPIIIGAALYGRKAGAWLGAVFGALVLATDAALFFAINVPGTVLTCMCKGILAGLAAGQVYKMLESRSQTAAVICAGIVCPIVNTGIFLLGCLLFFLDTVQQWGVASGYQNVGAYLLFGMVGVNFLIELTVNLLLSAAIVRILQTVRRPSDPAAA